MNILIDEIEDIAERIKLKIIAHGPQCVWAKVSGVMAIYKSGNERNEFRPTTDFVGNYTRATSVADIEEDLIARRRELAA